MGCGSHALHGCWPQRAPTRLRPAHTRVSQRWSSPSWGLPWGGAAPLHPPAPRDATSAPAGGGRAGPGAARGGSGGTPPRLRSARGQSPSRAGSPPGAPAGGRGTGGRHPDGRRPRAPPPPHPPSSRPVPPGLRARREAARRPVGATPLAGPPRLGGVRPAVREGRRARGPSAGPARRHGWCLPCPWCSLPRHTGGPSLGGGKRSPLTLTLPEQGLSSHPMFTGIIGYDPACPREAGPGTPRKRALRGTARLWRAVGVPRQRRGTERGTRGAAASGETGAGSQGWCR